MSKLKLNKSNMEFVKHCESVSLDFCIKMHNFYSLVKIN